MEAVAEREGRVDGQRFEFGSNWQRFLDVLDTERIEEAERSLRGMLGREDLSGRSFLDAGCGSGLFSLAAMRLGAERVHSFDYDPQSVGCAQELKRRYLPGDARWTIERGDVLDPSYLEGLGSFDVVYSWGVLHHTGEMWEALERIKAPLAPGGTLFIAIYNDQGPWSRIWRRVKRLYNSLPEPVRPAYVALVMGPRELKFALLSTLKGGPAAYLRAWSEYRRNRGMSRWHDFVDWVGGYPFEVAKPEQIFGFYRDAGYELRSLKTCGAGLGCNEYVFEAGR